VLCVCVERLWNLHEKAENDETHPKVSKLMLVSFWWLLLFVAGPMGPEESSLRLFLDQPTKEYRWGH
jgi:hypothetical protein